MGLVKPRTPRGIVRPAAALAGLIGAAGGASAVVVDGLGQMEPPAPGWVASWNGSSAVAVGPHWFLSAKHVGGAVGGTVWMEGVPYRAVEVRLHPQADLQMVRVAEELPGWHALATDVEYGDGCYLGGYGVTGGASVGNGYDWTGPRRETWGANVIRGTGAFFTVRFDAAGSGDEVPNEAIFAVNDSGGGLFVLGADGDLQLAGIATSVSTFGSSRYGDVAWCVNVDTQRNWIMPVADPSVPITSSVAAPRASVLGPGGPLGAAMLALGGAIAFRRPRYG